MFYNISVFELFFFIFVAFAWPLSISRMIRRKSTKGKSLLFSGIVLSGYGFGIIHKLLYSLDWAIFVYILDFVLVATDITVFFYVRNRYEKGEA